jgi:hypothetical protein
MTAHDQQQYCAKKQCGRISDLYSPDRRTWLDTEIRNLDPRKNLKSANADSNSAQSVRKVRS